MIAKAPVAAELDAWTSSLNAHVTDRTGQTDNERIKDILSLIHI